MHQAGWVGRGATAFLVHADHLLSFPPSGTPLHPSMLQCSKRPQVSRQAWSWYGQGEALVQPASPTHAWPPVCPWDLWARVPSNL